MTATIASAQPRTSPAAAALRSVSLRGPAGRLEALVNEGMPDARFAALVCHPHPLGGGSMQNKVVYHVMKALNDPEWGLGWPVLRFNFRGTGLSHGVHDGQAESADVLAALDWLANEYRFPLVVVGFSFGAMMALSACCSPSQPPKNVRALALLGLPTHSAGVPGDRSSSQGWSDGKDFTYPQLRNCTIPKLFLSGDRDEFDPDSQLAGIAASAAKPSQLVLLPRADHFFTGQLEPMQTALAGWLTGSLLIGNLKEQLR
ncbi:MAG: alpha/beta fold hydrolase [Terracidiphilus sp.]|jgi:alpha/beta superfamily hydrolase